MKNLNNISKIEDLNIVKVGNHGIAEMYALVGFRNLEQAEDIAEKEGLRIVELVRKNCTAHVYELTGDSPSSEYDILSQYEDCTIFRNTDADNFQEIDIDETLEGKEFLNDGEKETWLAEMNKIKERIINLANDEFIYLDSDGSYSEPIKERATDSIMNGDYYVIGLVE